MKIKLTDEQEVAVQNIRDFILDKTPGKDFFTLQGLAGSGKTFSIIEALRPFKDSKVIIGGTISHSAKSVLENSLSDIKIPCYTVAQLLNLTQSITDKGKIIFTANSRPAPSALNRADIVLIDECSMIDNFLFDSLSSRKLLGSKIIFLGDPNQLAPVGDSEDDSITFNYTQGLLKTPVRYTGPISDLGARLRKEIDKFKEGKACSKYIFNEWSRELGHDIRTSVVDANGSGYIFLNDIDDAINIAVKEFKNNPDDINSMRLLAYTNKTVGLLNNLVRHKLYEDLMDEEGHLPQLVPGELLISDGGYALNRQSIIYNNEMCRVEEIHSMEDYNGFHVLCPKLYPAPAFPVGTHKIIPILDNKLSRVEFEEKLADIKQSCLQNPRMWPQYYEFKDKFAWFEYNYSLTSHRSQGRTFTDAMVFEKDILEVHKTSTKIKLQSLYVACTRAKRRTYIFNSSYKVDQSLLPSDLREYLGI